MKKLLLALCLAGLPVMASSQVTIGTPIDLTECDANLDGYAMFDLSVNDAAVLNGLPPSDYTVTYYETLLMAENDTDALPDAYYNNIVPYTQSIYVRVTEIADISNYATSSFQINANPGLEINTPSALKGCAGVYPNDDVSTFDLTSKNEEITNGCTTCTVTYYKPNNSIISNPSNFTGESETLNVVVQSMDGCTEYTTLELEIMPRPSVPLYPRILSCDGIFNLTENNDLIAPGHIVSFYIDYYHAEDGTNAIEAPESFQANVSFVFVRVEADSTQENAGCYTVTEVLLTHADGYNPLFFTFNLCKDLETGEIIEETVIELDINDDVYSIEWFLDGIVLDGITGSSCTATEGGTYSFIATHNISGCVAEDETVVIELNPPVSNESSIQINGNEITISVDGNGGGYYDYRIDEGPWQESNIFLNVVTGEHIIEVSNPCGFTNLIFTVVIEGPVPPVAPPSQTLPEGSTLADIEIDGENIQWYSNQGFTAPPDGMNEDTPLPANTLLENGVTYYASQTVNGIESQRTGVTINFTLGIRKVAFSGLNYYPNPVEEILEITNGESIETITLYNVLGQKVILQTPHDTSASLDFTNLERGIYLVEVQSGSYSKTIRIVKQ